MTSYCAVDSVALGCTKSRKLVNVRMFNIRLLECARDFILSSLRIVSWYGTLRPATFLHMTHSATTPYFPPPSPTPSVVPHSVCNLCLSKLFLNLCLGLRILDYVLAWLNLRAGFIAGVLWCLVQSAFLVYFLSFVKLHASALFCVCDECGAFTDSFLGITLTSNGTCSFYCLCLFRLTNCEYWLLLLT